VKRYKKIKSCDPFSKVKKSEDVNHDEPPEIFEEKAHKRKIRQSGNWEDSVDRDSFIQRDGLRYLKKEDPSKEVQKKKEQKVQPKQENESMRDFKLRMRQQTRVIMNEELQKLTASSKRRKGKMIERTKKRKEKKAAKLLGHDNFKSDYASPESFAPAEFVPFGATSTAPPDLKAFTSKISSKLQQNKSSESIGIETNRNNKKRKLENEMSIEQDDDDVGEDNSDMEVLKTKKSKKKSIVKIVDREDMYGDDGLEGSIHKREPLIMPLALLKKKKSMKGDKKEEGNSNNTAQMEILRQRVQEAYSKIREKRRSVQSAYQ